MRKLIAILSVFGILLSFPVFAASIKGPIYKPEIPATPSNLTAVTMQSLSIGLVWHDNSNNESGFKIERSVNDASDFFQIATTSSNITAFFDNNLAPSTSYYYRIRAYNALGDSQYSNIATAITLDVPISPSNLIVGAVSPAIALLIWQDNANNETGFKVERSVLGPSSGFLQIATTSQNIASFVDNTVFPVTTYWYRVAAFNNVGASSYSNVDSVTTPAGSGNPGTISITATSQIPSQNIPVGVPNQPLGGFMVTVTDEPISVGQTVFRFSRWSGSGGTSSNQDLTNVTLVRMSDNVVVAGPVDITASAPSIVMTGTITYPVGTDVYVLKGKVGIDYATDDTIAASTTPSFDWTMVKGVNSNQVIIPIPNLPVTGNTMTVKAGALQVSTLPTPIAQTVVAGAQGFNFANFSFDATASGEDVRLNSVQIEFNFGQTNSNDDMTNCQLFDGTTALNTGTNAVNGSDSDSTGDDKTFTFDTSWIIFKGTAKALALNCNTTGTTTQTAPTYNWTLEIPGDADDMIPTGAVSGAIITETYNDTTGQTITLSNGGALFVALDGSSPSFALASANTTGVVVSAYRFTATNEDIRLTQVGLMLAGTASNTPQDITKLTIWEGATQVGTAIFTTDTATATISNVIIPKDADITLMFKVDTAVMGVGQPARPGHLVRVEIDPNAGDSSGDATRGIGLTSGATIYSNSSPAPSSGIRLVKTKPTLAGISLPSTKLINATIPLYRFSVSAPATGGAGLYKFTYSVATSTGGDPAFAIKNLQVRGYSDSAFSQPAYPNGGLLNNATGDSNGVSNEGPNLFGFYFDPVGQAGIKEAIQVPFGSTRYFELIGTVSNTSATSSSVIINLQGDYAWFKGTNNVPDNADNFTGLLAGNYAFATTAANVDVPNEPHDDFIWSDNATTTSDVATYDWFNGFVLPGLPSTNMTSVVLTP